MGKVGAFFRVEGARQGTRPSSARFLRVLFVSVGVCPGPCLGGGKWLWGCKQRGVHPKANPGWGCRQWRWAMLVAGKCFRGCSAIASRAPGEGERTLYQGSIPLLLGSWGTLRGVEM